MRTLRVASTCLAGLCALWCGPADAGHGHWHHHRGASHGYAAGSGYSYSYAPAGAYSYGSAGGSGYASYGYSRPYAVERPVLYGYSAAPVVYSAPYSVLPVSIAPVTYSLAQPPAPGCNGSQPSNGAADPAVAAECAKFKAHLEHIEAQLRTKLNGYEPYPKPGGGGLEQPPPPPGAPAPGTGAAAAPDVMKLLETIHGNLASLGERVETLQASVNTLQGKVEAFSTDLGKVKERQAARPENPAR